MFKRLRNAWRRNRDQVGNPSARQSIASIPEPLEGRLMMYVPYGGDAVWHFPNHSLSYSYVNVFDGIFAPSLSRREITESIEEAMGVWSAVTPLRFFELPDSGREPADRGDGKGFQSYEAVGSPYLRWYYHRIDGTGSKLAHGMRPGDDGLNGDIHFDQEPWSVGPAPNRFDLIETAAHEFGHALGLNHEIDTDGPGRDVQEVALMNPNNANRYAGAGTAALLADDVEGIQSLYGAGLGYVLGRDGVLHVYGTGASDLITVNVWAGNITATSQRVGQPVVQSFTRPLNDGQSRVTRIRLHGQGGNDILRVESTEGLPADVYGNDGNDFCDVQYLTRNFDNGVGPVSFVGGSGVDSAFLYDDFNPDRDTYSVTNSSVRRASTVGEFRFNYDGAVENVTLRTGSAANVVNVPSTREGMKLFLDSKAGRDIVNVGTPVLGQENVAGAVEVRNTPSFSTLNIDLGAGSNSSAVTITNHGDFGSMTGVRAPIFWKNTDTAAVNVKTSNGREEVSVLSNATPLTLSSRGGNDVVRLGSSTQGVRAITGMVTVGASGTVGQLDFINHPDAAPRVVSTDLILGGLYNEVTGLAPAPIRYANALGVTFSLGSAGDSFVVNTRVPAFNDFNVHGNGGADRILLRNVTTPVVRVYGGTEDDTLAIDDSDVYLNTELVVLKPDAVRRVSNLWDPTTPPRWWDIQYGSIQTLDLQLPDLQLDVEVQGTSPIMTGGTTIRTVGPDVTYYAYVRDAAGKPLISSNLTLLGTSGPYDDVNLIDLGPATPVSYTVTRDPAGTRVAGIGAGQVLVGPNVDRFDVRAGPGDDTVSVPGHHLATQVRVFGGGGNDTVNLGGSTLINNVRSGFYFDGQADSDTFSVSNTGGITPFTYTRSAGTTRLSGHDAFFNYDATFTDVGVETVRLNSSARSDVFEVNGVATGTRLVVNAGGGADRLTLGRVGGVEAIRGAVTFDGNTGADVAVVEGAGSTRRVAHIDWGSAGAAPGDSLFGPGGSLRFAALESLAVNLGSAADDVHAWASPQTALSLFGSGGADTLTVGLVGATGTTLTRTGAESGSYSFADRQRINFSQFGGTTRTVAGAAVAGRQTFFNHSALDGNVPAPTPADDAAIAADVHPLLPGRPAGASNVTSYSRGINGVMVDVAGLPAKGLSAADISLAVRNSAGQWYAPGFAPTVSVRRGAGAGGTDRVTLVLPDNAVRNTWLRVTVKANANTGLATPEVFYLGNLAGDTGGNVGAPTVDADDFARTQAAVGRVDAASLSRFDFNRDRKIDAADLLIVRNNQGRSLPLFTAPSSATLQQANVFGDVPVPGSRHTSARPAGRGLLEDVG